MRHIVGTIVGLLVVPVSAFASLSTARMTDRVPFEFPPAQVAPAGPASVAHPLEPIGAAPSSITSVAPTNWIPRTPCSGGSINEIRYGTLNGVGYFLGVAEAGQILYSTDGGYGWNCFSIGSNTFTDVEYGNNQFVAVGFGGIIAIIRPSGSFALTAPGVTWQTVCHGSGSEWIALGLEITGGGFTFVEHVARSLDGGTSWTLYAPPPEAGHTPSTTNQWLGSTFANGWYVAVRWDGRIQRGIDGLNWETVANASGVLHDVAFGNGAWVAVGDGGLVARSTNAQALTWSVFTSGSSNTYAIGFGGGYFVTGAIGGQIRSSTDGLSWANQISPVPAGSPLYAAGYGAPEWIVGGQDSRIAQTQPLSNLVPFQVPGWSSPLVVASAPGATVDDWVWIWNTDSLWVRFTPANLGSGDTPPFSVKFRTNGTVVASLGYPSLRALSYFAPVSLRIARPPSYPYSFQVDVDADAAASETNETDNSYLKTAATAALPDAPGRATPPALVVRAAPGGRASFDIATGAAGPITLDVIDLQGHLVRRLLDRSVAAEARHVEWDGTARQGGRVATGLYFARLTGPGMNFTRKFPIYR